MIRNKSKKKYEKICSSVSPKIKRKIFNINKNFVTNNNSYIAHLFYKNSNNIKSSFLRKKKLNEKKKYIKTCQSDRKIKEKILPSFSISKKENNIMNFKKNEKILKFCDFLKIEKNNSVMTKNLKKYSSLKNIYKYFELKKNIKKILLLFQKLCSDKFLLTFKNLNFNKKKFFVSIEEIIKKFLKINDDKKIELGFLFLSLITYQLNFFSANFSELLSFLINKIYEYIIENKKQQDKNLKNLKNFNKENYENEIKKLNEKIKDLKLNNWHGKEEVKEKNKLLIEENNILKKQKYDLEKKILNSSITNNNKTFQNINLLSTKKETILYNIEKKNKLLKNNQIGKIVKESKEDKYNTSSFKIQLNKSSTENLLNKIEKLETKKKMNSRISKEESEKRRLNFKKKFTKVEKFENYRNSIYTETIFDYDIVPKITTKDNKTQTYIKKKNRGTQTIISLSKELFNPIFTSSQKITESFVKELLFLKNLNLDDIIKNNKSKLVKNLINIPKVNIINNRYRRKTVLNPIDIKRAVLAHKKENKKKTKLIIKNFLVMKNKLDFLSVKKNFQRKISMMLKIKRITDVFNISWPKNNNHFKNFKEDKILLTYLENIFTKSINNYFSSNINQDSLHLLIKILILYQIKITLLKKKNDKNDFCIKFLKNNTKIDNIKKINNKKKYKIIKKRKFSYEKKIIAKKKKKK